MRGFLRGNGLTIFFTVIFLAAVALQGFAGWHDFNNDELRHGGEAMSLGRYLVSSEFGSALLENWQSEYLQFTLYICATVVRTAIYSNSLLIVMGGIWLLSWFGQSVTGRSSYNANLLEHQEDPISYLSYLGTADFWQRTLQNWQSEFLAVGSMAILSVYLRQRGSPESKPVGAPHDATGTTG
jgi:uncharacterized protein DUF6766